MRKFPASLVLSVVLALLPACVPINGLSTGAGTAASLGPDGVTVTESPSTLPERMEASANEIWTWYNALKGMIDPAIEPMRKLYVSAQEMVVAAQEKDWLKVLSLGATAWGLVDQIKGMVGK